MPKAKAPKVNFNRLSPAGKRRAIFSDIIATLAKPREKRFKVKQRVYFKMRKPRGVTEGDQFQKLLPTVEKNCTVCGIGACFIAHVRLANQFKIGQLCDANTSAPYVDDDEIFAVISTYFSVHQLRRIEAAFEGRFHNYYVNTLDESDAAYKWLRIIPNATNRLRAIAENGLRNNGTFELLQLPEKPKRKRKKIAAKKYAAKKVSLARG